MIIAISSSQGAGKTTLISALAERGYQTVERKTSRSILSDWGVTLQQVNNQPQLAIKFQEEMLLRKVFDDSHAGAADAVVITERSFVDLFVYSLVALGHNNDYSNWLDEYYERCEAAQQLYDRVYYLTAGHFTVQPDGVRGTNQHYSRMVDTTMFDYYKQITQSTKQGVILTPSLEERIATLTADYPL